MSPADTPGVMIPARSTVSQLAEALERDPREVRAVLEARGEPSAPDDQVSPDAALAVSAVLGVLASIEPRDLALEYLYECETTGELPSSRPGRAGQLASGVVGELEELDDAIESASEHWSVARMPVVDRNILRLGLFELRHHTETSTGVIVSEAVRLAQTYSTERSGAFVNGVLARLAKDIRGA